MKITISFLLILASFVSQGQSTATLIIGSGLDVSNSTLAVRKSFKDSVDALYSLVNQAGTTATNALNTGNGAQSTANTAAVINTAQTKTDDSLRARIKVLEESGIPIQTGSMRKTILASTYTITEADDNYSIFFPQQTTVFVQALTKPVKVRLYRRSGGTITVSPTITLFGISPSGVYYRRISSGGYADIDYDTNNSAQLTGNLTK